MGRVSSTSESPLLGAGLMPHLLDEALVLRGWQLYLLSAQLTLAGFGCFRGSPVGLVDDQ